MPILDLRIRKALRRGHADLAVASERPTTLDGGATETVRYAPGDAASFLSSLAAALGVDGYEAGDFEKEATAVAESLRGEGNCDQVIVWGERVWRSPGAVEALYAIAAPSEFTNAWAQASWKSPKNRTAEA